ncbi:MAG: hypothetical protein KAI76_02955, partial [Alphaproteobacteria bacterium]|nr:hypothetical protein [Alphaproteobacteria bacterium]
PELFFIAADIFQDLWEERCGSIKQEGGSIKIEMAKIERKTEQFLNRIVEADSTPLITAYENQVRTLEEQRIALSEKVSNCGRPLQSFDQTFRTAMNFLGNPQKLWASERMEDKKAVLRLVFADKLPYCKDEGFRTAQTTLPITLLGQLGGDSSGMVEGESSKLPFTHKFYCSLTFAILLVLKGFKQYPVRCESLLFHLTRLLFVGQFVG